MNKLNHFILAWMILIIGVLSVNSQTSSIYTNLTGSNCKTVKADVETGGSVQNCRAFGNWSLKVLDDDNRMSVNVVAPGGKEFELDFWTIITRSFSSLGAKAEWRVKKVKNESQPVALIIRVNSSSDENGTMVRKSYLTVTKITAGSVCVTDKIEGAANANQTAREAADNAADKPCLEE